MSHASDPATIIGTPQWWDAQLAHCWELNGGPAQSTYFMFQLIANLPDAEREYLQTPGLTILDWGCATGDGVAILGQNFPQAHITGLDIAGSAIEKASSRYPNYNFRRTQAGEIPGSYDVIVTSNCLEHFTNPLAYVREHLSATRSLYLILVPYRECPLMDGHLKAFNEESFPEVIAGFARIAAIPFATETQFWAGKQMLVVYGSREYVSARASRTGAETAERERVWSVYFQSPPEVRELLEEFAIRSASAETALMGEESAVQEALLSARLARAEAEAAKAEAAAAKAEAEAVKAKAEAMLKVLPFDDRVLPLFQKLRRQRERIVPRGTLRRKLFDRCWSWLLARS